MTRICWVIIYHHKRLIKFHFWRQQSGAEMYNSSCKCIFNPSKDSWCNNSREYQYLNGTKVHSQCRTCLVQLYNTTAAPHWDNNCDGWQHCQHWQHCHHAPGLILLTRDWTAPRVWGHDIPVTWSACRYPSLFPCCKVSTMFSLGIK